MRSVENITSGTILSFDEVCAGSPVIIMLQKLGKQVKEKSTSLFRESIENKLRRSPTSIEIKTHNSCRVAQETGVPHHEYIDRKKENIILTPLYLGIPYPIGTKFVAELPTS